MSNSLRPHEPQHTRPPCPSPTPGVHPNPCPLSRWCHPTISCSVFPFSFCPQSFLAAVFWWVGCSHQVAKILELQLQHQSFQWVFRVDFLKDWLAWSPCCLRSPPAPQFEDINSLVLCLLYSPALTTIRDHWRDDSLDYTDLCWQTDVFAFQYTV